MIVENSMSMMKVQLEQNGRVTRSIQGKSVFGNVCRLSCRRPTFVRAGGQPSSNIHLGWPKDSSNSFTCCEKENQVEHSRFPSSTQSTSCQSECEDGVGKLDIVGLGQAMNDVSSTIEDEMLIELGVTKGSRKVIGVEERAELLERLEGKPYQLSAGGSLSNTLVALARLGNQVNSGDDMLSIGMAGLVGSDPLGSFYSAQMESAGVKMVSNPTPNASTGTVVVFTSPDAQRTMLSYLGTAAPVEIDHRVEAAISSSKILCIEGYLWELPNALETIQKAIKIARRSGTAVALTTGDAGVVDRHSDNMWKIIKAGGIDILFANAAEAESLVRLAPKGTLSKAAAATQAERCALELGSHCSLVCVTDGSAGSAIAALGELHVVPPHWTESPPVDSCGAGDAYAAGFLYGYLKGFDVNNMGRTAARTASAVIAHQGATLSEVSAAYIVSGLPEAAESMTTKKVDFSQECASIRSSPSAGYGIIP